MEIDQIKAGVYFVLDSWQVQIFNLVHGTNHDIPTLFQQFFTFNEQYRNYIHVIQIHKNRTKN